MRLTANYPAFVPNKSVSFGTKIKVKFEDIPEELHKLNMDHKAQNVSSSDCPYFIKQKKNDICTFGVYDCHTGIVIDKNGDTYMFHNMPGWDTDSVYHKCLNGSRPPEDYIYDLPKKIRSAVIVGGMRNDKERGYSGRSVPLTENLEQILKTKLGVKDVTRISGFHSDNIRVINMHYDKKKDELTVYAIPRSDSIPENEEALRAAFDTVEISKADELVFENECG